MKTVGKRVAAICAFLAMTLSCFGTCAVSAAEETALLPKISGVWQTGTSAEEAAGEIEYPRVLNLNVDYGASYAGKTSVTALYDSQDRLISAAKGEISSEGEANYALSVTSNDAAKVKNFVWNFSSLIPAAAKYEASYADFSENMTYNVPEITETQGFAMRASFENGSARYFSNDYNGNTTYTVKRGAANTGERYLAVSGATSTWNGLKTSINADELGKSGTVEVSASMKLAESVSADGAKFILCLVVPTTTDGSYKEIELEEVAATDLKSDEWTKVTHDYDLSGYNVADGSYSVRFYARNASNTPVDFLIDDITIVNEGASYKTVIDDYDEVMLEWNFEDGTDSLTSNGYMNKLADIGKWTYVISGGTNDTQVTAEVVDTADESITQTAGMGDGTLKLTNVINWKGHLTARVKLSKADLVPGKEYELSFSSLLQGSASGKSRALYAGLAKHNNYSTIPNNFTGGGKAYALIANDGTNYYSETDERFFNNFVGSQEVNGWYNQTIRIKPQTSDFDIYGYTDLCIVMTYDKIRENSWEYYNICPGEALYIDNVIIKEVEKESTAITKFDNTGNWAKRATFEADTLAMFDEYRRSYMTITNTTAHTGKWSAKIANRDAEWKTPQIYLTGVDASSKITASCYVRNVENYFNLYNKWNYVNNSFQLRIGGNGKNGSWVEKRGTAIHPVGYGWYKLEETFDLAELGVTDTSKMTVELLIGSPSGLKKAHTMECYIDDFIIVSDKPGTTPTFYDDAETVLGAESEMTDTAYTTAKYRDTDVTQAVALYSKYSEKFKLGAAVWNNAQNNQKYATLFAKHFKGAVSNGYFQIGEILKDEDGNDDLYSYNFAGADKEMKFCYDNGISDITGHALLAITEDINRRYFETDGSWHTDSSGTPGGNIFYNACPGDPKSAAIGWMTEYITKVMKHFEGAGEEDEYSNGITAEQMASVGVDVWDVVNEAVNESNDEKEYTKMYGITHAFAYTEAVESEGEKAVNNPWLFWDYTGTKTPVVEAFRIADSVRKELQSEGVAEEMELRYNDFCLGDKEKAERIVTLVNQIKDEEGNLLVDKIGAQAHMKYNSDFDKAVEALDVLAAANDKIKVDISELDIYACATEEERTNDMFKSGITKEREYKQADLLKKLFAKFEAAADADKLDRVVFWTFADGYSYGNEITANHTDYAGIFDRHFLPKTQFDILTMTDSEFKAAYPDFEKYVKQ